MKMFAHRQSDPKRRNRWRIAVGLGAAFVLGAVGLEPRCATAKVVQAEAPRAVSRSVPPAVAPSLLHFSLPPADQDFLHTGLFAEPLVPVGATTPAGNQALARAVLAYQSAVDQAGAPDAVAALLGFLAAHPKSPWAPALQLNLGIIYRETGHFSQALSIWQAGWQGSERLESRNGQEVANDMVARLSQLEAYLGRKELVEPLLASLRGRPIGGTAAQLLTDSRVGMYEMIHSPGTSFLCGPLALERILTYRGANPSASTMQVLNAARSTPHGLSLTMVDRISKRAGLHYQMAYRKPGSVIIVPAVVSWKVGHYAALVDRVGGGFLVADTTFGKNIRISRSTLDQEGSGYYLVPEGALPAGWRSVSAQEGSRVWGRGNTGTNHDTAATGPGTTEQNSSCPGGCTTWSVELEVVGLQLHDAPVGYAPPVGPAVRFDLYYSHRDTQQPATFSYTNFGPKWTFTWLSYVTDNVSSTASATLYRRGGGNEPYTFSSTSATASYPGPYSQASLTRTVSGGSSTSFTLSFPDGSSEQFNQQVGNQFFMTAIVDPQGNKVTLNYDSQMRIASIRDAIGQVTTLTYGISSNPLLVSKITDPFGRSASFNYNTSGQLSSITDVLGISSTYLYGQGADPDFINTLSTPYGSTIFTYGDVTTNSNLGNTRFLKAMDPLGRATYVEFDQGVDPGDTNSSGGLTNSSLLPTGMNACNEFLEWRNTFYFDPNQYALATQYANLNYADATVYHWLHTSDAAATSRVLESVKRPLENRVWYNYPNQPSCILAGVSNGGTVINGFISKPSAIGRVLDSGATQLETFQYNAESNVTQATDAVGRQMTYTYQPNGVDVASIANTTAGAPQTLEVRTYNSQHEPLTVTGANGRTAHYTYNTQGQLTRYTDPKGHATAVNYIGGYAKTIVGPISGDEYILAYDNKGRIHAVTDPAGSTVRYTYDAADRVTGATYPDGTRTQYKYNLLDLESYTDRLGQTTQYQYDADRELTQVTDALSNTVQLGYNLAGRLSSLTDQNDHTTTWDLDAESRVTEKLYADGTSDSITYESAESLVSQVTDAMGQSTTYGYNTDDTISGISYYANTPTPGVAFKYDPSYRRLTRMSDGTGTTTYTYYPVSKLGANELKSVTSPIAGGSSTDVVSYTYDPLDRITGINANGGNRSITYDAAGRVTGETNPLDSFVYSYSDATLRVTGMTSGLGPTLAMSYYGPQKDELLEQITATKGSTSLNQLGYAYNSDDNVTNFSLTSPSPQTIGYTYDPDNRLRSGLIGTGPAQYQYSPDPASNLSSITINGTTQNYTFTPTNEITSGAYNADGSPTALEGNSYTWDGANRILSITTASGVSSTFTYNGFGRLARVVETSNGSVVADHAYLWCGPDVCQARDNTQSGSPRSSQYFPQGAVIAGTGYYYIRDKLGSVLEMITNTGNVAAEYSYDPYGNRTVESGTLGSDIGYAGYFAPNGTGLDFALARAYNPVDGRWLNRDPIAESGGTNLYAYANENPMSYRDPTGKDAWTYYVDYINLLNFISNVNADAFVFASDEPSGPEGSPVRGGGEGVVVGGISTQEGPYAGVIAAGVVQMGGQQNYIAAVKGQEVTIGCDGVTHRSFDAIEGSAGPGVPFLAGAGPGGGKYWSGDNEVGYFLFFGGGLLGDHASVGVGAGVGAPSQNYFPIWGGVF